MGGRLRADEAVEDIFYCTLYEWRQNYRFEINRLDDIPGILERDGGIDEWDCLEVSGTIRHHWSWRKTRQSRRRTGQKVLLNAVPMNIPRENWKGNPKTVGTIRTEDGILVASTFMPSDVFMSIFPCLAAGAFKERMLIIQIAPSLELVEVLADTIPDIRRTRRECRGIKTEHILVFRKNYKLYLNPIS